MPIEYCIDCPRKLVLVDAHGTLTNQDMFAYQLDVWSRPEVASFNELIDLSRVDHFDRPSPEQINHLTRLAAAMERAPSKLAIVAPGDLAFGLGRMYQALRTAGEKSAKQVGVFRTRNEAWEFLRLEPSGDTT